jgi:hypothetical protein
MAKSAQDLKRENELLREQISLNQALKQVETERFQTDENLLDNVRENRNIVEDITKALKFQVTEKKSLRNSSTAIYDITRNSFRLLKEELGLDKTKDKLLKDQITITKEILTLQSLRGKISEGDSERQFAINGEIDKQIASAKKLKKQIAEIAKESEAIQNNLGVKSFAALADLTKAIPGLSKFSEPFQSAAQAAREQAIYNKQGIKEDQKALETGKNLTAERIKKLGLEKKFLDKNGKILTGSAAKARAISKGIKIPSVSPLKAGFKALGPVIKKALGPISIILMIKDVIEFFVNSMFEASEQGAKFEKNLKVSGDEAQKIRKRTNFISNDMSKINGDSVDFSNNMNSVLLTQKEIIQAMEGMNASLGTSVDFTSELGEYGADLLRGQAFLTKQMGLTAKEAQVISDISLRQGKEQIEFTKEVLGTVEAQNVLNDTRIDSTLILKDIANLSADVRATIGDTAKELAKNVYQARKLGFEFSDLQSMQNNLLDFESSISKELEAELILGRDINLEKARAAALNNDLVGVGRELRKQNIDIKELQKDNAIAAQAAAEAMGMTVQQAIEAQEKFENINTLQRRINENKKVSVKLDEAGIDAAQLMGMSLEDIKRVVGDISVTESELAKILGEKAFEAAKARSAQDQFNDALAKAKEQFANLVDSGVLDALVQGLTSLVDSKIFATFAGGTKEDFQRRKDIQELQRQGKATEEDVEFAESYGQTNIGRSIRRGQNWFNPMGIAMNLIEDYFTDAKVGEIDAKITANQPNNQPNSMNVQDFTIRTHPKDTLVMAGGTKLNEDSKETNQLLKTLITAVENGGNVYLNNQLVGEISNQQQLNSFRAGS